MINNNNNNSNNSYSYEENTTRFHEISRSQLFQFLLPVPRAQATRSPKSSGWVSILCVMFAVEFSQTSGFSHEK